MGINTVIKDYGTDILNAIRENDLQRLRFILEKHLRSDSKIAKLCITDIKHRPTKKFACPMILAARQEDPRIMKYMMERGADPNFIHHTIFSSKRREVVTALHIAVDLGYYDTVEVLMNANADPNIADHNQETPLQIAIKKADRVMVRMLVAKGADPSIPDRRGNAALHVATLYGHLQIVKTLLKYQADAYQKGQSGLIPSHIAAREGHIHLVQVFCTRDIGNTNIKIPCFHDQREKAPIHLACEQGHVETVIALIDQFDADVNLKDSDGDTPLHCVVLNPYDPYRMREKDYFYACAKVLVKYRVSVNEKNDFGDTALHLAAMNHFQRIVELLLSIGANPFIENAEGLKPIDIVPDSDPVTKQMLKSAMLQPKPALHASQLSLQRDLDISFNFGNLNQPPLPAIHEGGGMAGMMPGIMNSSRSTNTGSQRPNVRGSQDSFQTMSSMNSVFVDDVKAQRERMRSAGNGTQQRDDRDRDRSSRGSRSREPQGREPYEDESSVQSSDQPTHVYQQMNEIPVYTKVDKKAKGRSSGRHQRKPLGEPKSSSSLRSAYQDDEWAEDDESFTTQSTATDTTMSSSTFTYDLSKMETTEARGRHGRGKPVPKGRPQKQQYEPEEEEDSEEEESEEEDSQEESELSFVAQKKEKSTDCDSA